MQNKKIMRIVSAIVAVIISLGTSVMAYAQSADGISFTRNVFVEFENNTVYTVTIPAEITINLDAEDGNCINAGGFEISSTKISSDDFGTNIVCALDNSKIMLTHSTIEDVSAQPEIDLKFTDGKTDESDNFYKILNNNMETVANTLVGTLTNKEDIIVSGTYIGSIKFNIKKIATDSIDEE